MDHADWLRQFRRAKTLSTLELMARRKAEKHPDQVTKIRQARQHREDEIISDRYLDTPC